MTKKPIRLVINLDKKFLKQLKLEAIQRDVTLATYLAGLLLCGYQLDQMRSQSEESDSETFH